MVKLISSTDSEVLRTGRNFRKSAIFYKDLMAFYDAYKNLMSEDVKNLPNYCYWNGNYSLEGICLFMNMYSFELGFASLKLTMPYLKTLYYYLAGYSNSSEMPERSEVEAECQTYRTYLLGQLAEVKKNKQIAEQNAGQMGKKYRQNSRENRSKKSLSMLFNVLAIVFLLVGIFCVIAPLTFYFLDAIQLIISLIVAAGCVVMGVLLFLVFKKLSRLYDTKENGLAYEAQRNKIAMEKQSASVQDVIYEFNKLNIELYEFSNDHNKAIFLCARQNFKEILARANQYSALSYNIKRDSIYLFHSQENDIESLVRELSKPAKTTVETLAERYEQIVQKDWLYNSLLVRYAFLNKFIETGERTKCWCLDDSGRLPFGVNAKAIATQPVAFLKSRDSLFVTSSADRILRSNYFKHQDVFKLNFSASERQVQSQMQACQTQFFDYEKVKGQDNLFCSKKSESGARVPDEVLEGCAKIPNLIYLQLRLIALNAGMEVCDTKDIKSLSSALFAEDAKYDFERGESVIQITENNLAKANLEIDEVSVIDAFTVKYKRGAAEFVGYKIN